MEAKPKSQPSVAARQAVLALLSVQITGQKPTDASESIPALAVIDSSSGKDVRSVFFHGGKDLTSLGAAVRWAAVQDADGLYILSEEGVGNDIARRLGHLDTPFEISAWHAVDGAFTRLEPAELAQAPEVPAEHWTFAEVILAAGAKPVDDHGRLIAEVAGLEVARVSEHTGPDGSSALALELGVGQADRELHQLVHGSDDGSSDHEKLLDRLTTVVTDVAKMLETGGVEHPLARVAQQRRIRAALVDNPSVVQAKELRPVPPLRPRQTVLGKEASAATGTTLEGKPLLVVCSAGVDLDLAAEAGDYRHRFNEEASIVVVVPERDRYLVEPVIMDLLPNVSMASAPES